MKYFILQLLRSNGTVTIDGLVGTELFKSMRDAIDYIQGKYKAINFHSRGEIISLGTLINDTGILDIQETLDFSIVSREVMDSRKEWLDSFKDHVAHARDARLDGRMDEALSYDTHLETFYQAGKDRGLSEDLLHGIESDIRNDGKADLIRHQVLAIDVWGNPEDGFEVNDMHGTGTFVMIPRDATDETALAMIRDALGHTDPLPSEYSDPYQSEFDYHFEDAEGRPCYITRGEDPDE